MSGEETAQPAGDSEYEPAYGPPLPPDRTELAFKRRNARGCDALLRRLRRVHPLPKA